MKNSLDKITAVVAITALVLMGIILMHWAIEDLIKGMF